MSSLKRVFTFSGQKFYKLFDNVADNMHEMAAVFLQVVYDDERMLQQHLVQMERIEHANDEATHRLFVELGKNFITPFDREDIHDLATSLDDVIDYMYGIGRKLLTFNMQMPDRSMLIVTEQTVKIVKQLSELIKGLRHKTRLNELIRPAIDIKKQIYACDNNVDIAIATLFSNGHDAMELLKKTELYDSYQYLLEKCGSVINSIESVVVKYA